jgi:endonuclease/exonuclease/phosphatase (EEP) superfamily protein YafD
LTWSAAACIYGYALAVFAVWLLLRFEGDRWWFATLLLYGPRWIYALPMVLLVPPALLWRRRWLLPLGLSLPLIVGPLMGFNLGWAGWGRTDTVDFRVLTYNIERFNVSEQSFATLLDTTGPDAVAVQECAGPGPWRIPQGWNVQRAGELLVASRHPILRHEVSCCRRPAREHPTVDALYCVLDTPAGTVGFCNVHLETPRRGLSAVLDRETILDLTEADRAEAWIEYRRLESADVAQWLAGFPEPKIIAGDFNMPIDSTIYRESWQSYANAFDQTGFGLGYTKQAVIRGHCFGLRIDHILTSAPWQACRCWVGPDLGSDHLPMLADLVRER